MPKDPGVITTYLGKYTRDHADAIAGRLEEAGISWWYKAPGFLSDIWEFGAVRLFVDATKLDEARALADEVLAEDAGPGSS